MDKVVVGHTRKNFGNRQNGGARTESGGRIIDLNFSYSEPYKFVKIFLMGYELMWNLPFKIRK